jgi:hypothetical protein
MPPLVNWALNNHRRADDTERKIRHIAEYPPPPTAGPTNELCARIAYGGLSPSQIAEEIENIKSDGARQTAKDVVPVFMRELRAMQAVGIRELHGVGLPVPIGRRGDGGLLLMPVTPNYFVERDGRLVAVFQISWTKVMLNPFQTNLLSSIVALEFLSQAEFSDADAEVWCFPRMKRSLARDFSYWNVRDYAKLSRDEIQKQFTLYSRAVRDVVMFFERLPE